MSTKVLVETRVLHILLNSIGCRWQDFGIPLLVFIIIIMIVRRRRHSAFELDGERGIVKELHAADAR